MKGIRAYGRNEGGLNHSGDLELLFEPLLPLLNECAIYGAEQTHGDLLDELSVEEYVSASDRMENELASLEIPFASPGDQQGCFGYYGPGFMAKFGKFIKDDWNELLCFEAPFPPRREVVRASELIRGFRDSLRPDGNTIREHRRRLANPGMSFLFRNMDACYWELHAREKCHVHTIREHLRNGEFRFDELEDFFDDAPRSKTEFSGVHEIWKPGVDQAT